MSLSGDVEIQIVDGGGTVVSVPQNSVQVVIGTCSGGTAAQVVASRDPQQLKNAEGSGPAVEAAALSIARGATVLFMKSATITPGAASAVAPFATGTSVVTVTGAPYDAYLVKMLVTAGGTVGTTGIRVQFSVDAGRTYGPEIALGTAVLYALAGTNLTLNFAAGTMVAGEFVTFGCTEPLTDTASIQACLVALAASPYAITGWGSLQITGTWSGADATTIEGFLDTMATGKTWTRLIMSWRDAHLPAAYGGAGETEAAWEAAAILDVSAVSAKRICMAAGFYNIPSQYPIVAAGLPRYRRPGQWALAARQVQFGGTIRGGPQTHAGRVSDGALTDIVIDPVNDPLDGFLYHDEASSPGLTDGRLAAFTRRKGKPGIFVRDPLLLSPPGSSFKLLPHGLVMDIGCSLEHQVMEENVNADVRTNDNGTIDEIAAQHIEEVMRAALRDNMLAKNMISGFTFTIDRTNNVLTTSQVNYTSELRARAYVLQINGSIQFGQAVGG
jgi:hypothetical protein